VIVTEDGFLQANIHSFIETDDRVTLVLKFLDEAILELDNMDGLVSSYKIHLNASRRLVFHGAKCNLTPPRLSMRIYHLSSRKTEAFKYRLRINVHCSVNLNNSWCVYSCFYSLLLNIRLAEDRTSWTRGNDDLDTRLIT
jgi:hypothetical protein